MIELLCALAVWRLSSLLVNESGPYDLFARLRHRIGLRYDERNNCIGNTHKPFPNLGLAGVLCCVWCCSLWLSFPFAVIAVIGQGQAWWIGLLDCLAFSTGAIIVETVVHGK